ncbi:MAG TPA: hypothetical protein VGI60_09550 [Chthoniobacterales bacterium]|jgi:hypothetical protein
MKILILSLIAAVATTTSTLAGGDVFHSNVLAPGDPPLVVDVPDGKILTVLNYQAAGSSFGSLSVTIDGKTTAAENPLDIGVTGGSQQAVIVAGPATVTVTNTGASVLFTYRIDPNRRGFANHTD